MQCLRLSKDGTRKKIEWVPMLVACWHHSTVIRKLWWSSLTFTEIKKQRDGGNTEILRKYLGERGRIDFHFSEQSPTKRSRNSALPEASFSFFLRLQAFDISCAPPTWNLHQNKKTQQWTTRTGHRSPFCSHSPPRTTQLRSLLLTPSPHKHHTCWSESAVSPLHTPHLHYLFNSPPPLLGVSHRELSFHQGDADLCVLW